jgi:hypothetical protein
LEVFRYTETISRKDDEIKSLMDLLQTREAKHTEDLKSAHAGRMAVCERSTKAQSSSSPVHERSPMDRTRPKLHEEESRVGGREGFGVGSMEDGGQGNQRGARKRPAEDVIRRPTRHGVASSEVGSDKSVPASPRLAYSAYASHTDVDEARSLQTGRKSGEHKINTSTATTAPLITSSGPVLDGACVCGEQPYGLMVILNSVSLLCLYIVLMLTHCAHTYALCRKYARLAEENSILRVLARFSQNSQEVSRSPTSVLCACET